ISHASHMASNYIPAESNADRLQENLNQRSGDNLIYSINDRPPWYLCLLLGFQWLWQHNDSWTSAPVGDQSEYNDSVSGKKDLMKAQ
ncbi:solute carrier family 23 member 1, partial [Tachysurus ichikawai]